MNVFELFASITLNSKGYKDALQQAQGDTQQAGGKISSSFSNVADKVQKALSTMAKVGASAIAITEAGIVKLAKSSLNAYAQYEQLVGGVDKLFGESASKVKAYAETAYTEAGLSANEYMQTVTGFSASLIQSLGQDTSKSADYANRAIKDMSDNANTFGTDISSIQWAYQGFAKANFTMLDNLRLGYGGTKEEMQRLIKDSAQMKDIQQQLGVTIDENSLSFATCVDAISVMQVAMGIAGTTSKEASKTIEGSINSMKASFKNLVTGIGNSEADLDGLFNKFADSVKVAFNNILPVVKTSLEKIPKLINGLVDVVGDNFDEVFATAIDSALDVVLKLGTELPKIFTKIFDTLPNILNKFVAKLGLDVDFNKLFDGLKEAGSGIIKTLQPLFKIMSDGFKTALKVIEPVGEALKKLGQNEKLLELIRNLVTQFLAMKMINGIVSPIIDLFGKLRAVIDAVRVAETGYNTALAITQGLFNTTPFGFIITALSTIGTLIFTLLGTTGDYNKAMGEEQEQHTKLTKIIDDEREAEQKLKDLKDSLIDKEIELATAIDNTAEQRKKLDELETQLGEKGEEVYKRVQDGTIAYSDLTEQQKELYKQYLNTNKAIQDQKNAEDDLHNTQEQAEEDTHKLAIMKLEEAREVANTSGNYEEYGQKVAEAMNTGQITSQEADTLMSEAFKDIDNNANTTFVANLGSYIMGASNSFSTGSTDAETMKNDMVTSFNGASESASDNFGTKIPGAINGALDKSKYEGQGNSLVSWFRKLCDSIGGFFNNLQSNANTIINNLLTKDWGGLFGGSSNSSKTSSDVTSSLSGYGFGSIQATSTQNGKATGMNGSIIRNTTNLHKGGIVIHIDGAGKNAEEIANKVSYELEKSLRRGRAVWA